MNKLSALVLAAVIGLAGCATQPDPGPKTLTSAQWSNLAADVAARLKSALIAEGEAAPVVHLQRQRRDTAFYAAFHDLLETQLLEQGFGVSRTLEGSDYQAEYSVTSAGTTDSGVQDHIVVNVAVLKNSRYATRISDRFVIAQSNRSEYFVAAPSRLIEVVGE